MGMVSAKRNGKEIENSTVLAVLFLLAGVGLVIYCIDRLIATHNARQSGDVSDHTQTYVLTSLGLGAGVLLVASGGYSLFPSFDDLL